jgi:hypothetical protein
MAFIPKHPIADFLGGFISWGNRVSERTIKSGTLAEFCRLERSNPAHLRKSAVGPPLFVSIRVHSRLRSVHWPSFAKASEGERESESDCWTKVSPLHSASLLTDLAAAAFWAALRSV